MYAPVRLVARVAGRMQRQTSAFTPSEGSGRRQGMGDKDVASLSDIAWRTAYCGLCGGGCRERHDAPAGGFAATGLSVLTGQCCMNRA